MAKKTTKKSTFHAYLGSWIYVEVRGDGDGTMSFGHVFIQATSEEEAYDIGAKAMRQKNLGEDNDDGHADLDLFNDYVIEMRSMFSNHGIRSGEFLRASK